MNILKICEHCKKDFYNKNKWKCMMECCNCIYCGKCNKFLSIHSKPIIGRYCKTCTDIICPWCKITKSRKEYSDCSYCDDCDRASESGYLTAHPYGNRGFNKNEIVHFELE